ncbi:FbpB family small basic protein [Rossellomorea sp. GCM10028870]
MKKLKNNLSLLIEQNKTEILNDKNEMEKIEERIDQKHISTEKENP